MRLRPIGMAHVRGAERRERAPKCEEYMAPVLRISPDVACRGAARDMELLQQWLDYERTTPSHIAPCGPERCRLGVQALPPP
jgi:hypothetical protein